MSSVFQPSESSAPARDDEVARLRVPPHSVEAEQSVIGGLLIDNSAWDRAGDMLTDGDFYRFEHRAIYAAIGGLINQAKPAPFAFVLSQSTAFVPVTPGIPPGVHRVVHSTVGWRAAGRSRYATCNSLPG